MRREWIEMFSHILEKTLLSRSPSMRREWIEITRRRLGAWVRMVSLHAEGVD